MGTQSQIVLLPNIGAEESHRQGQTVAQHPVVTHLGELWRNSFGALAKPLDGISQSAHKPHWNWLPQESGLMPWFSTEATLLDAQQRGLDHLGPCPRAVQTVHNKGFAAKLAQSIEHHCGWQHSHVIDKIDSDQEAQKRLEIILSNWPAWARANFTIKPCMGSSGRGRIAGKNGLIATQHIRGLIKMSQRGGAIVEPWYSTQNNLSTQLLFTPDKKYRILGHTSQLLTRAGTYLGNHGSVQEGNPHSGTHFDFELDRLTHLIAPLIIAEGFQGVCGFDAFSFLCPESGKIKLRAPLEVNARFTSATVGIGHMLNFASQCSFENGSWMFILDAQESWCEAAAQNPEWKSCFYQTRVTGKKALVAISDQPETFKDWVKENKVGI